MFDFNCTTAFLFSKKRKKHLSNIKQSSAIVQEVSSTLSCAIQCSLRQRQNPQYFLNYIQWFSAKEVVTPLRRSVETETCFFRRWSARQETAVSVPGWGRSPGEGNGYPHRYSCLENSMDEKPGGQQSTGSRRVRHDWASNTFTCHFRFWNQSMVRKLPNNVFET